MKQIPTCLGYCYHRIPVFPPGPLLPQLGQPWHLFAFRSLLLLVAGDWDHARVEGTRGRRARKAVTCKEKAGGCKLSRKGDRSHMEESPEA